MPGDPVQAAWQVAHVHLCKTSVSTLISCPLLLAVALRILRASVAVVTPVFLISLRPRLLRGALVGDAGEARIGLRGTARVSGDWTLLGYLMFRRPLAAAREWCGC